MLCNLCYVALKRRLKFNMIYVFTGQDPLRIIITLNAPCPRAPSDMQSGRRPKHVAQATVLCMYVCMYIYICVCVCYVL